MITHRVLDDTDGVIAPYSIVREDSWVAGNARAALSDIRRAIPEAEPLVAAPD